jgi:hypothetical protein
MTDAKPSRTTTSRENTRHQLRTHTECINRSATSARRDIGRNIRSFVIALACAHGTDSEPLPIERAQSPLLIADMAYRDSPVYLTRGPLRYDDEPSGQ